jgi:TRAP-type C4-dicarboxylate transport system permease small subunit
VIRLWALAGGLLLLAVMAVNVFAVVLGVLGSSFPGDFELTEVGVAVAAFAFLPYVQLVEGNVTADIFTERVGPRTLALFRVLASTVALLFAAALLWRMSEGMLDQRAYGYVTAVLQFPIWIGFVPALVSLLLLCVAAALTLGDAISDLSGKGAR